MTPKRGEIWLANLNPAQGSEQAGIRPVIIMQDDRLSQMTSTVITIPLTTNLRRAALPTCLLIARGDGEIERDSVALCHQMRVLDTSRLQRRLGLLPDDIIQGLEVRILFTLGF